MLTPVDLQSLTFICLNLRARDAKEIYGLRPHNDPLRLAHEAHYALTCLGRAQMAWHKGRPAGVLGFFEQWPGLWEAVSFGTDEYPNVAFELGRYGKKLAAEILREIGARRLQADVHADNEDGAKYIKLLGGSPEGPPMRAYGKDGADYQRFVWLAARDGERVAKVKPEEMAA